MMLPIHWKSPTSLITPRLILRNTDIRFCLATFIFNFGFPLTSINCYGNEVKSKNEDTMLGIMSQDCTDQK